MEKKAKYDRQLRLWGEHGQELLENAKICLLNATALGTETLKNLVLPGIGSFTIVDGNTVGAADLGTNFFLDSASIGTSRAASTTNFLLELNDLVQGSYLEESPENLIESRPTFFHDFTLVIASQIPHSTLLKLSGICHERNIPIVYVRSNGYIGYMRLCFQEHTVFDGKLEHAIPDLRIAEPFPSLLEYATSVNFEGLDSAQHSSIPYVVLLIRIMKEWLDQHNGKFPSTTAEKREFKALLNSKAIYPDEANFEEALKVAHYSWSKHSIPSEVRSLFEDSECNIHPQSTNFWVMSRALKSFVENEGEGKLPVPGAIPDMHSDTQGYLQLLKIYQSKSNTDIAAVYGHVQNILREIGRSPDSISIEEVRSFCKNASSIQVLRTPSFKSEYSNEINTEAIASELSNPDSVALYYVLFRAADAFFEMHHRQPGVHTADLESDVLHLRTCFSNIISHLKLTAPPLSEDYIHEFCRYGQSELHNIAAIIGGLAAQEVIKLITKQNVPLNHTLLLDTTKGAGTVLRF